MRLLRQRSALADETGVAVPMALAVVMVTLLLGGVAAMVAIQNNDVINRDTKSKAAVEAANAGLRAALYRLNTYQPQANYCPTEPTNFQVGTNGAPTATLCAPDGPGVAQGTGNGTSYTYWISRQMQAGDTCAGPSLTSTQGNVGERCITAVGTANGVSARAQERVDAYTSAPAFPTAIFGTSAVTESNNFSISRDPAAPTVPALIGTNGILTLGNGNTIYDGYTIGRGGSVQGSASNPLGGPQTVMSTPFAVPTPIYPLSTSANTAGPPYDNLARAQAGTCYQSEAQQLGWSGTWTQTNCDYEIQQGITYPNCLNAGLPVKDCDVSGGRVSWDPANRILTLNNNSSLVLQGGYYNFCDLYLSNNSTITIVGQATIFVDSPSDPGSGCASGTTTGSFTMRQNSSLNAGGSALNAQILVYGDQKTTPPNNTVSLTNNSSSSFALLAPFSIVNLSPSRNTSFKGAIVGYSVTLGNAGSFTYEADTKSFQGSAVPVYFPSYWEQCSSVYSASNPPSGCG